MSDALFSVDVETRTIRGLLLPFGELSRRSVSGEEPVMFSAETDLALPIDPMVATLYDDDHNRFEPRGRGLAFESTPEGVVAAFTVAKTPEGDELLQRAQQEPKPRLSPEIKGLVRRGTAALKGAITGASIASVGAFGTAALFSAIDDVTEAPEPEPAPTTDPTDPTESTEESEPEMSIVPDTVVTVEDDTTTDTTTDSTTANGLFAALAHAGRTQDRSALADYTGGGALFAISTIQDSGPDGKAIAADTRVPQFVGELWKRRRYQRKFIPLFNSAPLTSLRITGWKWTDEPEVGDYAGNTAEVPSNPIDTEPVSKDARRLAGGHKLDRRFVDFGDTTVYASYFDKMTESYARKSDLRVVTGVAAAATARDVSDLEIPSGVAAGLAGVVDGALGVIESENTPTFSIVSAELWRDIVLTGKNEVLGYLNASLGLEEGSLEENGFKILPGPVGLGKVLTGAREAATVYELGGGSPIRVEGIDPHHGAIDPALFGYCDFLTEAADALAMVDTATYANAEI